MPFDSSKVKFQDQLDQFFRLEKGYRPEETKKRLKKKKQEEENKPISAVDDYINAYETRKKEQNERRKQMLFLKRLENDGETVEISKKDRDLLKNYGKAEEEKADKDLEAAVAMDIEQTKKDIEDNLLQEADKEDEKNKKDVMGPKQRNPESMIEKLRVKRMKSHCASTNAVSRTMNSKNAF